MSTKPRRTLPERFDRVWRLALTGLCFAGFSIGSCVLVFVLFPALHLMPGGADARRRRARRLIQRSFGLLVGVMRAGGIMQLELSGADELRARRNALVLANHPTLVDVCVLLAVIPDATCVVKSSLWRRRIMGGPLRAAGYIPNDAPERFIAASAQALRDGGTLVIFPEGTRSSPEARFQFQRGAAYIALQSGADIVPVVIACDPPTLTKSHRWYDIPDRTFRLRVAVKAARPVSAWVADAAEVTPASARRLTHSLENYFVQEIRSHESLAT
jgi:1-acyl-sn-glycerol-3-phosphate acyltransferase